MPENIMCLILLFSSYNRLENNTTQTLHCISLLSAVISILPAHLLFLSSTVLLWLVQWRAYTFHGPSPIFPSISPGGRWAENYDCVPNLCLRFHIQVFPLCLPLNSEKPAKMYPLLLHMSATHPVEFWFRHKSFKGMST